nr:hypothetical protein FVER53263_20968 [Fusarium verticillioides]
MAAPVLVIDNIAKDTDEETLMQVFSEYGEVLNTIVMRDADTGRSRHFGFVTFSTAEEAEMARTRMHNQELDGRRIVMRDRDTGRSRGFGYVTYSNPSEAESAIGAMNDQEIDGNQVKVNLANARVAGGGGGGYAGGQGGYGGGYQQGGGYGNGGYSQGGYGGGY